MKSSNAKGSLKMSTSRRVNTHFVVQQHLEVTTLKLFKRNSSDSQSGNDFYPHEVEKVKRCEFKGASCTFLWFTDQQTLADYKVSDALAVKLSQALRSQHRIKLKWRFEAGEVVDCHVTVRALRRWVHLLSSRRIVNHVNWYRATCCARGGDMCLE